eukprot:352525-Chlamydomonas_euryale.AAC.3
MQPSEQQPTLLPPPLPEQQQGQDEDHVQQLLRDQQLSHAWKQIVQPGGMDLRCMLHARMGHCSILNGRMLTWTSITSCMLVCAIVACCMVARSHGPSSHAAWSHARMGHRRMLHGRMPAWAIVACCMVSWQHGDPTDIRVCCRWKISSCKAYTCTCAH